MVFAAAGCSSSSKSSVAATTSAAPTSAPSTAAPATAAPTTTSSAATLALATNAKVGQQIVVDSAGHTVYLFVPDGASTASRVPAAIKAIWPPVTSSGSPTAGAGLDQAKVTVEVQSDGTRQVAYNGHLLYTFARDTSPGDANGQGLAGIWYVLSAAGTRVT
jgi:predicted lipoprotein with Yx(FWY)xxD motif